MRSPAQTAFAAGTRCKRQRQRLDDEVVDRELVGRARRPCLRRAGIGLLAERQQLVHLDVGGEIEMRDGLLGLDQPARDGRAHAVERHLLVSHALIERLDLRGARTGRHRWRARPRRWRAPAPRRARRSGRADRTPRYATDRCRLPPASRRASGVTNAPPGKLRRTEVARRRAHLEERIELVVGEVCRSPVRPRASGDPVLGPGSPLARGRTEWSRGCARAPVPMRSARAARRLPPRR